MISTKCDFGRFWNVWMWFQRIPVGYLLPEWPRYLSTFLLYLMHPASTVRQTTSSVFKYLGRSAHFSPDINWRANSSLLMVLSHNLVYYVLQHRFCQHSAKWKTMRDLQILLENLGFIVLVDTCVFVVVSTGSTNPVFVKLVLSELIKDWTPDIEKLGQTDERRPKIPSDSLTSNRTSVVQVNTSGAGRINIQLLLSQTSECFLGV